MPDVENAEQRYPAMKTLIKALVEAAPNFVFFPSLLPILHHLCALQRGLHGFTSIPCSILLTGPRGIGKSFLFDTVAQPKILAAMVVDFPPPQLAPNQQRSFEPLTFFKRLNLVSFSGQRVVPFHNWAILAIMLLLSEHPSRQATLGVLQCILRTMQEAESNQQPFHGYMLKLALLELPDSPERACAVANASDSPLSTVSACLKDARVAVLFMVDEAENLFKSSVFTESMAGVWRAQMLGVLEFQRPSIGFVLCTNFQRAHQLFYSRGGGGSFPPEYTHLGLRTDWNGTKFPSLRMSQPTWTVGLLSRFIWATQTACLTQDALDAEAARLDGLFVRTDCEEQPGLPAVAGSFERFLREYGHTPQLICAALRQQFSSLQPPCPWPEPISESDDRGRSENVPEKQLAQLCLAVYISVLPRDFGNPPHLGFYPENYAVPLEDLFNKLVDPQSSLAAPCTATGCADLHGRQTPSLRADRCINAAIDSGMLVMIGRNRVAIADPGVNVQRICASFDRPTAGSWRQHRHGEDAEHRHFANVTGGNAAAGAGEVGSSSSLGIRKRAAERPLQQLSETAKSARR